MELDSCFAMSGRVDHALTKAYPQVIARGTLLHFEDLGDDSLTADG